MLHLESEVHERPRFYPNWGQHFITGFFFIHIVKPLMRILALLPISSSLWKPRISKTLLPYLRRWVWWCGRGAGEDEPSRSCWGGTPTSTASYAPQTRCSQTTPLQRAHRSQAACFCRTKKRICRVKISGTFGSFATINTCYRSQTKSGAR